MSEKNMTAPVVMIGVAIVFVALSSFAVSGCVGFGMMGSWMGFGGWGWMGLGMVVFWIFVIFGGYLLLVSLAPPRRYGTDRALDIARDRFARGEITLEEFEKIRRSLY